MTPLPFHVAMDDPHLLGPFFHGASWAQWRTFAHVIDGHVDGFTPADVDLYRGCTGRTTLPSDAFRTVVAVVGRGGGKSFFMAAMAVHIATAGRFRLAPGEHAVVMVLAADRRQARIALEYIRGLLHAVPLYARMIVAETTESITLDNGALIEVHTANYRRVRGYSVACAICDEIAFWSVEGSSNPDREVITALQPALARVPGSRLLVISTPYARRGWLWDQYRRHHGRDGSDTLIWVADSRTMNPTLDAGIIARALADDEAGASAEYLATFRRDVETYVPRDAVDACVVLDRREVPPSREFRYAAFVDPSGGSVDSMTLAVAHLEDGRGVLDLVREWRPPFSPTAVVMEACATLREYGVHTIRGDRYAGLWPRERFGDYGVTYQPSEQTRSELYQALLPLVMSGSVELLDHPRLIHQLSQLERRVGRSGKDSIDHGPGQHDDVANAVAGALVSVRGWAPRVFVAPLMF